VVIVGILPYREATAHDAARMGAARRSARHPPATARARAAWGSTKAPGPARAISTSAKRARTRASRTMRSPSALRARRFAPPGRGAFSLRCAWPAAVSGG